MKFVPIDMPSGVAIMTYTTIRGFLWWKKTEVTKFYYLDNKWWDLETDAEAAPALQQKFNALVIEGAKPYLEDT